MSYPVLTRLGVNQFWYKHWYADSKLQIKRFVQHDQLMETLLELYINYGLTSLKTPFARPYWFKPSRNQSSGTPKLNILKVPNLNKFYRRFYYSNDILSIEHSFLVRHVTAEYFPLRIWILKYHGWIILSFKVFKPNKISRKHIASRRMRRGLLPAVHSGQKQSSIAPSSARATLSRLKLLALFLHQNSQLANTYSF